MRADMWATFSHYIDYLTWFFQHWELYYKFRNEDAETQDPLADLAKVIPQFDSKDRLDLGIFLLLPTDLLLREWKLGMWALHG